MSIQLVLVRVNHILAEIYMGKVHPPHMSIQLVLVRVNTTSQQKFIQLFRTLEVQVENPGLDFYLPQICLVLPLIAKMFSFILLTAVCKLNFLQESRLFLHYLYTLGQLQLQLQLSMLKLIQYKTLSASPQLWYFYLNTHIHTTAILLLQEVKDCKLSTRSYKLQHIICISLHAQNILQYKVCFKVHG